MSRKTSNRNASHVGSPTEGAGRGGKLGRKVASNHGLQARKDMQVSLLNKPSGARGGRRGIVSGGPRLSIRTKTRRHVLWLNVTGGRNGGSRRSWICLFSYDIPIETRELNAIGGGS